MGIFFICQVDKKLLKAVSGKRIVPCEVEKIQSLSIGCSFLIIGLQLVHFDAQKLDQGSVQFSSYRESSNEGSLLLVAVVEGQVKVGVFLVGLHVFVRDCEGQLLVGETGQLLHAAEELAALERTLRDWSVRPTLVVASKHSQIGDVQDQAERVEDRVDLFAAEAQDLKSR